MREPNWKENITSGGPVKENPFKRLIRVDKGLGGRGKEEERIRKRGGVYKIQYA